MIGALRNKYKLHELLDPDYPSKIFSKLIKKMPELPQDITFHGLRSSCVSILVHQGKDVKSIQKRVGHAHYDTTLRIYAKVKDKESKREISDTMQGIIQLKTCWRQGTATLGASKRARKHIIWGARVKFL